MNKSRNDPSMEGAQALSADDFKAEESWITNILNVLTQKSTNAVPVNE